MLNLTYGDASVLNPMRYRPTRAHVLTELHIVVSQNEVVLSAQLT